ncbi:MAG: hypothetical protein KGQ75_12395 [Sphingomonadales bacterium]|nr:hypothetical protein [Sphingomonadales bacterium]
MHAALPTLALSVLLMVAGAPPTPVLHGTYQADCAPYDGAAFRVTLPTTRGRLFELRANAPLEAMIGTWNHDGGNARPGSAMILSCSTAPNRGCNYPDRGWFTIMGKPGGQISGSFFVLYPNARRLEMHSFTARPVRGGGRMLCG